MIDLAAIRAAGNKPRVHGNGFVQLDMLDGRRLHVFGHPSVPAQKVNTAIHDHRFSFTSTVLRGELINMVYVLFSFGDHTHEVHRVRERKGEDTVLVSTGLAYRVALNHMIRVPAGEEYAFPYKVLHKTDFEQPTVTVIEKTFSDPHYSARVMVPIGEEPDNEFDRYAHDEAHLWHVLEEMTRGL